LLKGIDERTNSIYAPIQEKLALVEERLHGLRGTSPEHLQPLIDHVLSSGGKRVRPAITLLAADLYPHDSDYPVIMAGAVELLHLATLIHDDTVDDSDIRRGQPTVSNLWGKQVAVLFGDYLFATSATFVCDTHNVRVIRRFSETIMELASGELVEYFNTFNTDRALELYRDRIYHKTASLFCTAGETGAILGGAPEPQVQAVREYCYNIGMAFQMVDDLLDVQGDAREMGKPVGKDLLQGVLTLPTIMLMEKFPDENPIKELFADPSLDGKLDTVLDMINNSSIVDECYEVIGQYCARAAQSLETLPDRPARSSLEALLEYMRERSR
jgi:geranylgeranyl pyrophosphate synthase